MRGDKETLVLASVCSRRGNQQGVQNLELKVGDSLAITGKLDGKEYFLWGLKEPSYIMKMMAMEHCWQ